MDEHSPSIKVIIKGQEVGRKYRRLRIRGKRHQQENL